jgi:hypothetical protein
MVSIVYQACPGVKWVISFFTGASSWLWMLSYDLTFSCRYRLSERPWPVKEQSVPGSRGYICKRSFLSLLSQCLQSPYYASNPGDAEGANTASWGACHLVGNTDLWVDNWKLKADVVMGEEGSGWPRTHRGVSKGSWSRWHLNEWPVSSNRHMKK